MKFVFASDSFTGTLSSSRIAEMLTGVAHEFFPECETVEVPVADGSYGTVDVVTEALGGEKRTVTVHNPFMEEISAAYVFERCGHRNVSRFGHHARSRRQTES